MIKIINSIGILIGTGEYEGIYIEDIYSDVGVYNCVGIGYLRGIFIKSGDMDTDIINCYAHKAKTQNSEDAQAGIFAYQFEIWDGDLTKTTNKSSDSSEIIVKVSEEVALAGGTASPQEGELAQNNIVPSTFHLYCNDAFAYDDGDGNLFTTTAVAGESQGVDASSGTLNNIPVSSSGLFIYFDSMNQFVYADGTTLRDETEAAVGTINLTTGVWSVTWPVAPDEQEVFADYNYITDVGTIDYETGEWEVGTYISSIEGSPYGDVYANYYYYDGTPDPVAYSTANFTNVTSGSENLHLAAGSALIDAGTDLSITFTTDIDGETRQTGVNLWDIGADEYIVESQDYTKEDVASLPANDTNLSGAFTAQNYTDVSSDNNAYVDQTSIGQYAMFLYKDKGTAQHNFTVTWKGKSDYAPSSSVVKLQIYDRDGTTWEDLDDDNATGAGTEFTLTATVTSDLDHYYDANYWIACRVYQRAI